MKFSTGPVISVPYIMASTNLGYQPVKVISNANIPQESFALNKVDYEFQLLRLSLGQKQVHTILVTLFLG